MSGITKARAKQLLMEGLVSCSCQLLFTQLVICKSGLTGAGGGCWILLVSFEQGCLLARAREENLWSANCFLPSEPRPPVLPRQLPDHTQMKM